MPALERPTFNSTRKVTLPGKYPRPGGYPGDVPYKLGVKSHNEVLQHSSKKANVNTFKHPTPRKAMVALPSGSWNRPLFKATKLDPSQVVDARGVGGPILGTSWWNQKLGKPLPKTKPKITPWDLFSRGVIRGVEQTVDWILPDEKPKFRVTTWRR